MCRFGGWSIGETDEGSPRLSVWYNNKGWHALPSYYGAASNMMLRAAVPPAEWEEYGTVTVLL